MKKLAPPLILVSLSLLGAPAWADDHYSSPAIYPQYFSAAPYLSDLTCSVDQASRVNAAATAASAAAVGGAGATLLLPQGCIQINSAITPIAGLSIRGVVEAGTVVHSSMTSGSVFGMLGDAVSIGDLTILNTNALASAGTSVAVQMSNGIENPNRQRLANLHIEGFNKLIEIKSGQHWSITNLFGYHAKTYGINVNNLVNADSGDGLLSGSTIQNDVGDAGSAGIFYETGGGLKLVGNKVLQFSRALDLQIPDGKTTSDLLVDSSNSFENQSTEAVRLGRAGTSGVFRHIVMNPQVAFGKISVNAGVSDVSLCPMINNSDKGIQINAGDNISTCDGWIADNMSLAAALVTDPATHVTLGQPQCISCAAANWDGTASGTGAVQSNRYGTEKLAVASSSVYTNFYTLTMGTYQGATIDVMISGILQGVGAFQYTARKNLISNGSAAITVSDVYTPATGGAAIDVQYDVSTPGSMTLGVRRNAGAGGSEIDGSVSVVVGGKTVLFSPLL